MSKTHIIGQALPNLPWEDQPQNSTDVVWRYSRNPIIPRNPFHGANSTFNSAAVPFNNTFAGVFRCDSTARDMQLHAGFSDDGIHWQINPERIEFINRDTALNHWEYGYDPRVVWIEDRYYITWCNGYHGPTIGLAWTRDFKAFHQLENAFLIFNRNGVLFPRKINNKYWLLFYHGVLTSCNGFVYSFGAALLDLDEPWKVIHRSKHFLIAPWEPYECIGDVANVTFPCAALTDAPSGRIAIYYGCADTVTGLCFTTAQAVIDHLKAGG